MSAQAGRRVHQNPYEKAGMEKLDLPPRPFLYTIDQIATILCVTETTVRTRYLYFHGRSTGLATKKQFYARNIAPDDEKPDWRVTEVEVKRWFKHMGFKWYERGGATY